jgi:hypothetical protein
MATAIIWDIILILQIEFNRDAIAKASKALTNPRILNIHVLFALSSVVLYFILIFTGRKLLKGNRDILKWHGKFGLLTLIMRTLTFVTSFFAVIE